MLASTASAGKEITGFFGNASGTSAADGGFNTPRAVAVNASGAGGVTAGDVYVADASNNRVQRFSATGVFQGKFGATGAGAGQLSTPTGVVVDQSDGSVYVYDQGNRRVAKFTATGTFLFAFGAGVADGTTNALQTCTAICFLGLNSTVNGGFGTTTSAPSLAVAPPGAPNAGNLFVADPGATANRRVQQFTAPNPAGPAVFVAKVGASGAANGQFGSNSPTRVGVDDAGRVYAVDAGNNRVQRFTTALAFDTIFATDQSGSPAAVDIAIDPGTVSAGDASDDRVEILKQCTASLCPGATLSGERRIREYDTVGNAGAGAVQAVHGVDGGLMAVNGLAMNTATNRLYVSATTSGSPAVTAHRVWILDDVPPPVATIGMPTDVTAHSAMLNGSVTAGGVPTGYHFEYQRNGGDWIPAPPNDASAGSGTSPAAVSQAISGLEPSTLYKVRLVAKHSQGEGASTSSETTFVTDDSAPTVGPVASATPTTTSAVLTGRVSPNSQQTDFHFEYGTTTAYGGTAPASTTGADDGADSVVVSATVSGLDPDTAYHFRLVAENASGEVAGEDHVFRTLAPDAAQCANADLRQGAAALLPDCRAYERVTPADKNGTDAVESVSGAVPNTGGQAAVDGGGVSFRSSGAFAGAEWGGTGSLPYVALRDGDGWDTTSLIPRPENVRGLADDRVVAFTPDLESSILRANVALTTDLTKDHGYYLRDPDGGVSMLATHLQGPSGAAATPDLGHLVFDSQDVLTGDGQGPIPTWKTYEATGGQIRLVSRAPGTDAPLTDGTVGSSFGGRSTEGAISHDGQHIFFTAPNFGNARVIYRRDGGLSTVVASPSKRTPPDPGGQKAKIYRAATPDGSRVFFTSLERLTNDANSPDGAFSGDVYRYDADEDELIDLSAGTIGLTRAEADGVLGISDSGDRVYFAARGQVVPGEGAADAADKRNIYLWEDDGTAQGTTRYVTTVDPADASNWSWDSDKTSRVTRDGRYLLFDSANSDVTGYPAGGTKQVYRYDADADQGAGELSCVSCDPGGPPAGSALVAIKSDLAGRVGDQHPRSMSEDGRRVLFSSPDPLVDRDTNGEYDAYMWQDGEIELLSTGRSSDGSFAYAASDDGDDVYFRTREALVTADGDTLVDIYTAHVGGGFASQIKDPPPACEGDGCKPPPANSPAVDTPSSEGNHGLGNVVPLADCGRWTVAAKRSTAKAKRLRRQAARASTKRRATRLRRQATRVTKQAKSQRAKAKRCTKRNEELSK